jgi:ADP-heptose:LPS heptosyltransferase
VSSPPSIGPLEPVFSDVHRIAVLRGSGLGDLVGALPAVAALRAAYPEAQLTLLGAPIGAALFENRPSPFASVEVLPVHRGVRDDGTEDQEATADFFARMRATGFDLAVQIHGGGRHSNPFLLELGARHTVGTRTEDAPPLERNLPYAYYQHETLRALEVAALAGAGVVEIEPRLPLTEEEHRRRAARVGASSKTVALHPGATDLRRRWPPQFFGELAAALAQDGVRVVVVGGASDVPLADAVVATARRKGADSARVCSVAGTLSLSQLVDFFVDTDLVVANDSGPRHLAAAIGVPTVGIYWFGNVVNHSPLGRRRHRIKIGWMTRCPVCDVDLTQVGWTAERCEHDESLVADISPDRVLEDAQALLAGR